MRSPDAVARWVGIEPSKVVLICEYTGGGFGIYINTRTHLEGWDVDLAFRQLGKRLRDRSSMGQGPPPLALLAACIPCLGTAAPLLAGLRSAGAIYGLAWVPETDQASRRFYARAGWEPDGQLRVLDAGDRELREIRITGSLELKLQ